MSFEFVTKLPTPTEIKEQYPVPEEIKTLKAERDAEIADVITGKSDKLLVIIGPCSADNETAVLDYTSRLVKVQEKIIDKQLLEENQQHRYRFTVGHEASHDILHTAYFAYDPCQISMFDDYEPMIQCRLDTPSGNKKNTTEWNDCDWMEWQANTLSSAILMPKCAVELIANRYREHKDLKNPIHRCILVAHISNAFDVSIAAATIRLKDLGYIDKNDTTDYSIGTTLMDFASVVAAV